MRRVYTESGPWHDPTSHVRVAIQYPAELRAQEAQHIETQRQHLIRELVLWHEPLTAIRHGMHNPVHRFHVFAPGDDDAPKVPSGCFLVYDAVRHLELVFPIDRLGPVDVDVGRAVADHLGVTERDLGRVIRLGGRTPPLLEPIYGALTQIGNVWASVRTISDLVEYGGDDTDRFLLQTNGDEFWLRDQLYGTCYELTLADLEDGTPLAEVLRCGELTVRPGKLVSSEQRYDLRLTDEVISWDARRLAALASPPIALGTGRSLSSRLRPPSLGSESGSTSHLTTGHRK